MYLNCRSVKQKIAISQHRSDNRKTDEFVRFLNKLEGEGDTLIIRRIDLNQTSTEFTPNFKWQTLELSVEEIETMFAQNILNNQRLFESALPNATLNISHILPSWPLEGGDAYLFNVIANAKNISSLLMHPFLLESMQQNQIDALPDLENIVFLSIDSYDVTDDTFRTFPVLEIFLKKLTKLKSLEINAGLLKHMSTGTVQPYQRHLTSFHTWLCDAEFFSDKIAEFLQRIVLPKIESVEISGFTPSAFLSDGFVHIMKSFKSNNPSLKKLKISPNYDHYDQLVDMKLRKILLVLFAAMPNVQIFEVECNDGDGYYGGTRAEIYEKFLGSEEVACATLNMMR